MKRQTVEDRFMEHCEPEPNSGCWLWLGALSDRGYGHAWHNGRVGQAHRVAYELFRGEIPEGMQAHHKCDNRICVNPDHLWLGTQSENIRDCVRKGRFNRPKKLNDESAAEIYRRVLSGQESLASIGRAFGITYQHVQKIRDGRYWGHITGAGS